MSNQQVRHIAWTWNNYQETENYVEVLKNAYLVLEKTYMIYAKEVAPSTGTNHLQGYSQFKKRVYLSTLRKILPGVHFTICNGSSQDNINYIHKTGEWIEEGTPRTQERRIKKLKDDWEGLISKAISGRLEEIRQDDPKSYLVYYRTLKQLRQDYLRPLALVRHCYWIYGKPGVGKSRAVHQMFPHAYWKNANKWWDGYKGEPTVVLDDLGTHHLFEYLKRWADRYPVTGEIKGSSLSLTYNRLIITSNFTPNVLGGVEVPSDTIEAIQRRFLLLKAVDWSLDGDFEDLIVEPQKAPGLPSIGALTTIMTDYEGQPVLGHLENLDLIQASKELQAELECSD